MLSCLLLVHAIKFRTRRYCLLRVFCRGQRLAWVTVCQFANCVNLMYYKRGMWGTFMFGIKVFFKTQRKEEKQEEEQGGPKKKK